MDKNYTDKNSKFIDKWIEEGWEYGEAISVEDYKRAKNGEWVIKLTPSKIVPKKWFNEIENSKILGLASGGGQQMPILSAFGGICTVLDYSEKQLLSEQMVAKREGYKIKTIKADMTKPLPFKDESFDLIFHPVSNCFVEDICPLWKECYRVLKKGGILLSGLDNSINYIFDVEEKELKYKLPFNPLKNKNHYEDCMKYDWGITFSHTLDDQIGGQLKAGFILTDIYEDVAKKGNLSNFNIPSFFATRAVKR